MFAQESVMDIKKVNHLLEQFEKTKTFKRFFSTLLRFDEDLDCFVATEKWRDKEAELLTAAWWMFAELAKPQAVPEWISVEDGLPSDGQNIIAFDAIKHCVFKDGEFLQGYFEPDTGHEYTEPVDVTHWIAIEAQEQK